MRLLLGFVFVSLLALEVVVADMDLEQDRLKDLKYKAKFCSELLNRAISIICNNTYYTPMDKKNEVNNFYDDDTLIDELVSKNYRWYLPSDERAFQGYGHRFKRDGIIDRCCKKECTVGYLKNYCSKK